jgi:hypothetical protein
MFDMQVADAGMVEVRNGRLIEESLGFEDTVTANVLRLFFEKRLARRAAVNVLALPAHLIFLSEGVVRTASKGRRH